MASASSDDLSPFLSNFRISNAEGVMRMVLTLDSLEESRALSLLCRLCALLRESPHNRHALASRGLVGAVLPMLARFSEAVRIELLQLLRLAGMQRLTVHDSRATLQQLQALEAAGAALLRAEADGSPTQRAVAASTAPQSSHAAATRCLELLRLLRDVVASSLPEGTPAAFWDMGPGALGATGFDLPASGLVGLAAQGSLTAACWVQLDPTCSAATAPTTLLSLYDVHGCGLQLQLHPPHGSEPLRRDSSDSGLRLRAELLVSDSRREPTERLSATRLLGGALGGSRVGAAFGMRHPAADQPLVISAAPFSPEVLLRPGSWHFVLLSLRRGSLLSRDEALLSIDGQPAAAAAAFRYPNFTPTANTLGATAAVGAAAGGGRSGGGLRGLLGPFAFLGAALGGAEMAPTFEAAAAGRAFFELPQIAAAWHPRLTDGGGACVAVTAEGTWLARPRSEHISCVDTLSARDSLGGMLPLLRPLLPLRRRSQPRGAELLPCVVQLLASALREHARNQSEMLRSEGMLLLGHLLRAAAPCHFSAAAVDALVELSEACRDCPPLQRALIECVLLRFDIWRRLATDVRSAHLSLLTALAASDEAAAIGCGLSQRLLDAARTSAAAGAAGAGTAVEAGGAAAAVAAAVEAEVAMASSLQTQHLLTACILSSEALAALGAPPLLAHVLCSGSDAAGQQAALELLLQLAALHEAAVLPALTARGGLLALVHLMLSPPNRAVALLAARLVCAPLAASDRIQAGLRGRAAGQPPAASGDFAQGWAGWMRMRGLAAVRLAFRQLPPSPEAGECLVSLVLAAPAQPTGADFEAVRIACPRLLPALLDACGRSEPPQALALLERFCLWLRLCPENCELLTAQPALWQPQFARLLGRYAGEVVAAARGRGALAASALADSVASPPARRSKASGADVLTMLNELLCTYLVESLPLDPCWRALDLVLTLVHGCSSAAVAQAARRALLSRLLASLQRSAQRLAADLPASTPKLRRLCRAVRMHTLSALPPAQPVRVRLVVGGGAGGQGVCGQGAGGLRVGLRLLAGGAENAVRGASDRWLRLRAAEGAAAMGAEAAMIGSLLALLDPLLVRAMMDDEADVALRARAESTSGEARLLTSLAGSFAHGLVGASTLAGRVGAGLKGTLGGLVSAPRSSSATSSLSGTAISTAADAAESAAAVAAAVATATTMAVTDTDSDGSSLHSCLLQQLLLLLQLPALPDTHPAAQAACVAARQRLRELLWRDLEQGSAWAMLASHERAGAADESWPGRRKHVLHLLVSLALPLRRQVLEVRDVPGTQLQREMVEALVPPLQGVLRTYRLPIAADLAAPEPLPPPAAAYDGPATSLLHIDAAVAAGATVDAGAPLASPAALERLAAALAADEPPAWMSGACSPEQFLAAFGAWGPLLDAPLLREAAAALEADNAAQTAAAVSDAAQRVWLAQAAWASVAEEEAVQCSEAAEEAAGAYTALRAEEARRVGATRSRAAALAAHAAQRWKETHRSLQQEQGAWEAPQEQGAAARAEERCELLECEDYWRRRVLQLPNPQLTDHAQASLVQQQSGGSAVRDGSVGDDARESEGSLAKLRQAAKLAKTVVRIASDGAVDDPQLGDEDEEDEAALDVGVADLGPRGGGSLRVSSGEAGGSPASPQRKSGQPEPAEAAAPPSPPRPPDAEPLASFAAEAAVPPPPPERAAEGGWDEAWLFDEPCELVWRGGIRQGVLRLSKRSLHFDGSAAAAAGPEQAGARDGAEGSYTKTWLCAELKHMQRRRYLLMHTAVEVFVDASAVFLNVLSKRKREALRRALRRAGVPERSWRAARAALLDAWQRRELSNFEYLMELNTLSGRTFNDLNQYPVFPWVLADYTSPSLNLTDPASYRDLSKPVGALTDDRLAQVIERYEQMEAEADMPRFHYGSHYSSAGAVLFWLLRLEPYTSYSIELQSGRFDHADRLFASLEEAWHSCTTSLADVKELVPEFFYLPDFLRNDGGFELGVRQDHKRVGDVVLPMWARSADDFIAQHRRALESEHVSSHLHLWVDLIFGAKQQGQAAQEAHNVFFYLTYEGAVDLESVADPAEREALSTQIACFGQTPMQLFAAPHPPRRPPLPFLRPVHWGAPGVRPFARVPLGVLTAQSRRQHAGPEPQGGSLAIAALCLAGDLAEQRRLVVLDARSAVHSFRWPPPASRGPVVSTMRRQCSTQLPGADSRKSRYSALLPGGDGGRGAAVLSGGHWDGTLCVSSEAGRTLHAAVQHSRTITCLAVSGALLITGAEDTTAVLWFLAPPSVPKHTTVPQPLRALRGHVREISAVAVSAHLDLAASGAVDGRVLLHTCHNGALVRSITHPEGATIGHLHIASLPHRLLVGAAATSEGRLRVYSLGGACLHTFALAGGIRSVLLTPEHMCVVVGGVSGEVCIWRLDDGALTCRLEPAGAAISSISARDGELIVGTQEGEVVGYALDPEMLWGRAVRDATAWATKPSPVQALKFGQRRQELVSDRSRLVRESPLASVSGAASDAILGGPPPRGYT